MKVYIFTSAPFPMGTASTNRISCYYTALIKSGLECEIISISQRQTVSEQKDTNIKHTNFKSNKYYKNKLLRAFTFLFYNYKAIKYLCHYSKQEDVILIYDSIIWQNIIWLYLSIIKRKKLILELCEIPYLNDKSINKIKRWFQLKILFKFFKGYIAISDPLVELATRFKKKDARVIKVPILINTERWNNVIPRKNDFYLILHTGGINEYKDGLASSLKAFALSLPYFNIPVKYAITGIDRWQMDKEVKKIIDDFNLRPYLLTYNLLNSEDLIQLNTNADLVIVNLHNNTQNTFRFPTKIGEALFSETTLITTNVGESKKYLKNFVSAYIIEPNNIQLLSESIISAVNNREKSMRIAKAGKKTAEQYFDCLKHAERLRNFIESL